MDYLEGAHTKGELKPHNPDVSRRQRPGVGPGPENRQTLLISSQDGNLPLPNPNPNPFTAQTHSMLRASAARIRGVRAGGPAWGVFFCFFFWFLSAVMLADAFHHDRDCTGRTTMCFRSPGWATEDESHAHLAVEAPGLEGTKGRGILRPPSQPRPHSSSRSWARHK